MLKRQPDYKLLAEYKLLAAVVNFIVAAGGLSLYKETGNISSAWASAIAGAVAVVLLFQILREQL